MNPAIATLLKNSPVITDGAWGTMLQRLGLGIGECADHWNLLFPDRVEEVGRAYVKAGSQIILTNTFRSNRISLKQFNLENKIVEINRKGVELSRKAADDTAVVFASIGPSGKLLMMGEVSEPDLEGAFAEQAQTVAKAGAHGIVLETFSDLAELKTAVRAARKTGLPVVACMVFDSGKDNSHTMMGISPEQAAKALTALRVDVVGANCGRGIKDFPKICSRLSRSTHLPIWVKPNAGTPELIDGQPVYKTNPEEFAGQVPELVKAGADFVGGCCGTDPDFVKAIPVKLNSAHDNP